MPNYIGQVKTAETYAAKDNLKSRKWCFFVTFDFWWEKHTWI